jgi:hypothetical protein
MYTNMQFGGANHVYKNVYKLLFVQNHLTP